MAVAEWYALMQGDEVPLERALGVFDLFIPDSGYGSPGEVRISFAPCVCVCVCLTGDGIVR